MTIVKRFKWSLNGENLQAVRVFLASQLNYNYLVLPALDSGTTTAPEIRKMHGKGINKINKFNKFNSILFFYFLLQAYIWDHWFQLVEPYTTLLPYMLGVGNHEQDHEHGHERDPSKQPNFHPSWFNGHTDSGGECGVPMTQRFHMPENGLGLWW